MSNVAGTVSAIVVAILGLALVAVLVSAKAQTGNVITSAGNALGGVIGAAVSPVTGGGPSASPIGGVANVLNGLASVPFGGVGGTPY